jgi:hypothetical protein
MTDEKETVRRKTIVAETMDDAGRIEKVEINIEDAQNTVILLMTPCSPTRH